MMRKRTVSAPEPPGENTIFQIRKFGKLTNGITTTSCVIPVVTLPELVVRQMVKNDFPCFIPGDRMGMVNENTCTAGTDTDNELSDIKEKRHSDESGYGKDTRQI